MQLERSYFRRVNVLRSYIYEQGLNARRAYFSIRLAVKTSRPHLFVFQLSKTIPKIGVGKYNLFSFEFCHPKLLLFII